jgi:hypothetical protein
VARIEKLRDEFARCRGTFRWRDFEALLKGMGFVEMPRSGGSGVTYFNQKLDNAIKLHAPPRR